MPGGPGEGGASLATSATIEARARAESDRKFRAAARHSRHVRALRLAIPLGIAVLLAGVVMAAFFNPLRMLARLPLDRGGLIISGTRITMEAPRLAGFTRDARGYEVTARAASQDITKPDVLELRDIRAKVEMQDKAVVELTAASGLYETKSERVTLNKDIVLTSSAGYEGRLSEAVVDVKSGNIVSQNPVEVKLLNGTLNANRLEVSERGDVIRFDGGVVMNLTLGASGREKAP